MKNPAQLTDEFITWIGVSVDSFDSPIPHYQYAENNHIPENEFGYVYQHLIEDKILATKLVTNPDGSRGYYPYLTYKGWQKFQELEKNRSHSKLAFKAMQFENAVFSTKIFKQFAEDIEAQTGFRLRKLPEANQPMGLIDDHLRVEIKRSRFLVAEISELNPNVIWEAGFAEGLGKKVDYLCEDSIFRDRERRRVFDIEHQLIIPWSEVQLELAINKLIDTIRNTFDDALGL